MFPDQGLGIPIRSFAEVEGHEWAEVNLSDDAAGSRNHTARVFNLEADPCEGVDAVLPLFANRVTDDVLHDRLCVEDRVLRSTSPITCSAIASVWKYLVIPSTLARFMFCNSHLSIPADSVA
eukprot:CAMPEP_0115290622 /NCGR_PEP_ID=MMETSP0270-20121206/64154_1 /TAXON_ID=71861 /ORGANISM="Scrippsiella trochoidea, Strain CCMP3099" /LENGTH=121 /DNA_ID=CAMNT_0002707907 /DNA_START=540 /DNA_END=902 /DNA_ORIENTATION=-